MRLTELSSSGALTLTDLNNRLIDYCNSHDEHLRSSLISLSLPLVESIAKRFAYKSHGEPLEDLIQVGTIGLIKAADHYNPQKDVQFNTYGTHQILGEIRHYLRDKADLIRHPRWFRYFTYQIYNESEILAQKLNRFPTPQEIADSLNVDVTGVLEVLKLRNVLTHVPLEEEREDPFELAQKKIKSQRLVSFQLPIEDKISLLNAVDKLVEIEKKALYLCFYYDLNQTEIGKSLGLNQRAVSRLINKALGKLKNILK